MKRLIKALMVSVALICLASGVIYIWARGSLPKMDGTIEIAGITAPIRITQGRNAVPHSHNPVDGSITTANNKIVDGSYPHFISKDWAPPYWIRRTEALLTGAEKHSVSDMQRMQGDMRSHVAVDFLPRFLTHISATAADRPLTDMMSRWDGTMNRQRPEPLLFWSWYPEVTRFVFKDDFSSMFQEFWRARPVLLDNVLQRQQHICDDERTENLETCADFIARAFDIAVAQLNEQYGSDLTSWRWGAAYGDHTPFTHHPALAGLFDIKLEAGGDGFPVNAAAHRIGSRGSPFQHYHGASYRAIYDLSDLDRSLFKHSTGQSGNILSSFYGNFAEHWHDVAYISMSMDHE